MPFITTVNAEMQKSLPSASSVSSGFWKRTVSTRVSRRAEKGGQEDWQSAQWQLFYSTKTQNARCASIETAGPSAIGQARLAKGGGPGGRVNCAFISVNVADECEQRPTPTLSPAMLWRAVFTTVIDRQSHNHQQTSICDGLQHSSTGPGVKRRGTKAVPVRYTNRPRRPWPRQIQARRPIGTSSNAHGDCRCGGLGALLFQAARSRREMRCSSASSTPASAPAS